jgi:methionine-rich copper-binding protein CopC
LIPQSRFSLIPLKGKHVIKHRGSAAVVLLPALAPGKYQARWQTTSADSRRIQGQFVFEIEP